MSFSRRNIIVAVLAMAVLFQAIPVTAGEKKSKKKPLIQLAILLDTSNSMDGLINQAKAQLWKIVNEFTLAKRSGQRPEIQVALYEYGNDSLNSKEGYIRRVLPLTSDLDKVSEKLFGLTTNGGSEYCGHVIQVATNQLDWSKSNKDLKVIVIAGNEPFDQGDVNYRKACKNAIKQGVVINTIHCGSHAEGARTGWKDGAMLADGSYMNIDQDKAVVHIDAPQDKEIAMLGAAMNKTYIPYGSGGGVAYERQAAQDSNASSMAPGSMVNRAVFKSSANYDNSGWDLVDAVNTEQVKVGDLDADDLPDNMKKMSAKERKEFIAEQAATRAKTQKKIAKLNKEREEYVAKKRKELHNDDEDTLDSALIKSMRKQAVEKNFKFE